MEGCELLEIKLREYPSHYDSNIAEEIIDAGCGPMKVGLQGPKIRPNSSQCCIVTFHDLGLNYLSNFQAFFNYHLMRPVVNCMPVIHVNAPGQEDDAKQLPDDYPYPSVGKLADSVRTICNYYGVKQVLLLGVGLGANVMARVALNNPDIIDGLFMINPVPTAAGWSEWLYQKKNIYYLSNLESGLVQSGGDYSKNPSFPQSIVDYLVWYHFGTPMEERNNDLVNMYKSYFSSFKIKPRNLALLIESYLNRDDIGVRREENEISCSSFILCGNDSPFLDDSIEMNQRLRNDRSGWMKLFDCGMVLDEQPSKVAEAFILFVQGLGLGLLTHHRIK